MSLSGKIFVGLLLGIATGLFFGELAADLKILGDIFIKLLQITVLPYIVVSLIAGIGRMQMFQAKRLAVRGSLVLILIWLMALVMIFVASQAFPELEAASFFGSTAALPVQEGNLLDLYLPSNVFFSLANNMVPAVVFFSLLMGVALITADDKNGVLPIFDGLTDALARINYAIVQLTPLGIFAIAAAAAGTMTIEELGRVQVYLVTYIALAALITFWIFPGLIAVVSGIPFREVLSTFRDTLVTAFATGNQFVVLPQIAENCKTLLKRNNIDSAEADSAIDIIVPVAFNFPSLGKLLVLLFVLFAAWFTDNDLDAADRLGLAFNGLFSLFGSINVAVPYLLDSLQIPADMFQLFLVTGVVVGRFGAMLAALHIIVLSVIGTLALCGKLRFSWRSGLRYILISGASLAVMVVLLRGYFITFVPDTPPRQDVLAAIHLMEERVSADVVKSLPVPITQRLSGTRLDHILRVGTLRVGYRPKNLPCSFLTPNDVLVGFDVEMAHILAEDMGVKLQFVPFEFDRLGDMLDSGQIDIAMSCIASLPDRYANASFSRSYLDLDLAFIVLDHRRDQFSDVQYLQQHEDLSIAMVSTSYFEPKIRRLLPQAKIVYLEAAEDFFTSAAGQADALLLSAQEGAAYSYRYPQYGVTPPRHDGIRFPAAYPVPKGDFEMMQFVSNWVELKQKEGTIDALYEYWMLGGAAKSYSPRWSVIKDVLGWVD